MIGRTLANYRVVSQLGAGGMGVVYKAVDVRLDRSVALKVLPPGKSADADRRARFLQEARSASALNDPHIVTIHDIFVTEDGTDVLVMELIQGRTLRDVIADRPVPEGEALRLMLQVADGVGAAHAAGIVHRDLKPGNIMVTDRGLVKILDFGLAKLTGAIDEQQTMLGPNTVEGTLLGTVDYMSPEQARGEHVDHRSDIFSLGAVLYELLTGVKPFHSAHTIGVLHEILYGRIVSPRERRPEISGDAEAITLRALERDVHRRYQSMEAMASDLRAAQRALSEGHSSASRSGIAPFVPPAIPSSGASASTPPVASRPEASTPSGFAPAFPAAPDIGPSLEALGRSLGAKGKRLGRIPKPPRVGKWGPLPVLVIVGIVAMSRPDARQWVLEQVALVRDGASASPEPEVASPALPATPYELTQQGLDLLKRFDGSDNLDTAIDLFERAIAANADYAPAHAAIARAYVRQATATRDNAWLSRATDAARHAVELDGFLADAHVSLGLALSAGGDHTGADDELKKALALDSKNSLAWLASGDRAYAEGRLAEAAAAYEQSFSLDPTEWRAAVGVGTSVYKDGRYDDAIAWYKRAATQAPSTSTPEMYLASALGMKGDFREAAASLQRAISIRPSATAYSNWGTMLFLDGRYRESVVAFEKGVELRPSDPLMWGNLGDAHRWTPGGKAQAERAYRRAIQLLEQQLARDPENARDRSRLALYLAKSEDTSRARSELEKIVDVTARDVDTVYRAAATYELTGERRDALRLLAFALKRGYSERLIAADPEFTALRGDVRFHQLASEPAPAR
jgi:serine/threonine protein kinase/tetratricopeptide (TPR) repeat protein